MCRLFAMTSQDPISPMAAIEALEVMKEGHDGSGVGLFLTDLGPAFKGTGDCPVLSGIFTDEGLKSLDLFMMQRSFLLKKELCIRPQGAPPPGTPQRGSYCVRMYEPPVEWRTLPRAEREFQLLLTRLTLRKMGEEDGSILIFSFWPDVIMIKEVGDPLTVARYLGFDRPELEARIIMAQGRQNTNYAINIYACHPFFIQGVATMTNGENTAFVPIREYLGSRGFPGYTGYQSDSEVFTHILHYNLNVLGLGLPVYKHVITPLKDEELGRHVDGPFLRQLKRSLRFLTIDGPNCVIGCLPDKTLFLVQDSKKLRPGVVGGRPGLYAISSEMCGLDAAIPDRDKQADFQPMKYDTVAIGRDRKEIQRWSQWEKLPPRP